MKTDRKAIEQIRTIFNQQSFGVLSTQKQGRPYASLVGFHATEDLKNIIFLTPRTTRKFDHIVHCSNVAILVNNSRNQADDFFKAASVTATGVAQVPEGSRKETLLSFFLDRHPNLLKFSKDTTTALVCIRVSTYYLVNRFQDVTAVKMS
jgi:nitroimidazol reductase NimA-like FMN-containing flavoprotein (pyridoxamine 5'-phosphate oxidase superfamily)